MDRGWAVPCPEERFGGIGSPVLLCQSPAVPSCISEMRSGWCGVPGWWWGRSVLQGLLLPAAPGKVHTETELQHDTQIATSEWETVTQTISHPLSILYQVGLGDSAATVGKTQGRNMEDGSPANPSPRATLRGREVHSSQKRKKEKPFKHP